MERAGLLGGVKLRSLIPDKDLKLRGETLEQAIKEDLEAGLIPFYVSIGNCRSNVTLLLLILGNDLFTLDRTLYLICQQLDVGMA